MNAVRSIVAGVFCLAAGVAGAVELLPSGGDDAPIVQAALNAADEGGEVTLLPGDYVFNSGVTLNRNVALRGVHCDLVSIRAGGANFAMVTISHAQAVVSGVTLRGSSGSGRGARIIAGTLEDSCVRDNNSSNGGAGVILSGADAAVRRCRLFGNVSTQWGGAVRLENGVLENSLLYGNKAQYGGGVYIQNGGGRVINCTSTGNTGSGADFDQYYDTALVVTNCAMASVYYDRVVPNAGCYNTNSEKNGTKVASFKLNADYLPKAASPLVGGGVPVAENRYLDGTPHDATPNAGCYPTEGSLYGGATIALRGKKLRAIDDEVTFDVTFGTLSAVGGTLTLFAADGSVFRQEVSDGGAANFALSVKGGYSAVLDVDCGGYSVRRAFASVVSAGLDTVRVSQTSPHPAPPYDTWDNAAHTLQTAYENAVDGVTILVSNGVYTLDRMMTIDREITIRSLSGATETTLKCGARVFTINHPDAVVSGFTIKPSGEASVRGGVLFGTAGGTLEWCHVDGGMTDGNGGCVSMQKGALVSHCILSNGRAGSNNWGGCAYFKTGGRMESCLLYGGSCKYGGNIYTESKSECVLVNCTLGATTMSAGGGNFYLYDSRVFATNCIFSAGITGGKLVGSSHNLLTDPGFANVTDNDYRLTVAATTAIDKGNDAVLSDGDVDLDGRLLPWGEHVDIGCYEYAVDELTVGLNVDRSLMEAGASVTVTPVIVGAVAPHCMWTFLNLAGGEPVVCETDGLVACAQQLDVPGLYRILLSVTDGGNAAEAELAGRVAVRATGTYFVSKTGGGVPPFDTWEKAATNLTAAVVMAGAGSVVTVGAGDWLLEDGLVLDRALELWGAGRDSTFVRTPANSPFGVLKLSNNKAKAGQMTLTGTVGPLFVPSLGCAGVTISAGTFQDGRVTGCSAPMTVDGIAARLTGASAVMSRTIVDRNANGASGCVYMKGGAKIDNCLMYGNSASWAPSLYVFGGNCKAINCTMNGGCGFESNTPEGPSKIINSLISSYSQWGSGNEPVSKGNTFVCCAHSTKLPGEGNVADPLDYVNAAAGDYHLKRRAPSRGKGLYSPEMEQEKDLDGQRRAYAGAVDIGCYQTPATGLSVLVR